MTDDYEYRGLMAEAWDLLRGDYSKWPDQHFYRQIIEQRGGPALDVGCGTGRHTLDYLAAGLDVDGVDVSPEMLAICRAKAAALGIDLTGRLFEQPMQQLALPRRYATIFVPSLSFQLLLDPADVRSALQRFYQHLLPGGLLVMAISGKLWRGRTPPAQLEWSDWTVDGEQPREDGALVRRWSRLRYDHERQLVDEAFRYEVLVDGAVVHTEFQGRTPTVCWYTQGQVAALCRAAGFTDVRFTVSDGFDPAPPGEPRVKLFATRT